MFEVNYKDDSGRWQDSPVYAVDKKNSRFLLVDDNGRFFLDKDKRMPRRKE